MIKKVLAIFDIPTWLFLLLLLVFILRIPSFFEPYSYGDETIYLTLGEAIRQGIPLYSGVHDNKPPLLYLTAAIAGNLFWFKVILAFWNIFTIRVFWELSKVILPKLKTGVIVSTIIFGIFTTIPTFEGNIANAELFMIGPTILAFLILLKPRVSFMDIFVSGLLFSVSALFKIPAFFDVGAIVFLWLIYLKKIDFKNIKNLVINSFVLATGFLVPILIFFLWFYIQGSFREYLVAAFLQNVGYLSSWRPEVVQKSFLEKNLPLLIRLAVVLAGALILFVKRRRLSKEFVFVSLWLLFSLFGVTLSERPYPHYLVQSIGAIGLLFGFFAAKKNYEQVYALFPLSLAFLVPFYFHFWHYLILPYYQRFINLATGRITSDQYLSSFGENVPRYYKVSKFIAMSTKPEDKIFIWGEGSQVYALSRRFPPIKYVADYHIADFSSTSELMEKLSKNKPVIVAVFPNTRALPIELGLFLDKNYSTLDEIDGVVVWRLVAPKEED